MRALGWAEALTLRSKLIAIFVAIKVVPLLLLALFAWGATSDLAQLVTYRAVAMSDSMLDTQRSTGKTATEDAIEALTPAHAKRSRRSPPISPIKSASSSTTVIRTS